MINCLNSEKLFRKLKRFTWLEDKFNWMTGNLISIFVTIFEFACLLLFFTLFNERLILVSFRILNISLIFFIRKLVFRLYF